MSEHLTGALVEALATMREPHKSGRADTGTFGYSYLTLPDLSALVRAAFAEHGLAFIQQAQVDERHVTVTTSVLHSSGETFQTAPLTLTARGLGPQDIGSVITYARRYQLAALVGLSGSDDDDAAAPQAAVGADAPATPSRGRAGSKGKAASTPTAPPVEPSGRAIVKPMTDAQRRRLWAQARAVGYGDKADLTMWAAGILDRPHLDLHELSTQDASVLIDALTSVQTATREKPTQPVEDEWTLPPPDEPHDG